MRYPASEKLEIIRIVEQSHLPAKRTLDQLGIARRTFYRWYDRYLEGGPEALEDRPSAPSRVWNRIPPDIHDQIIELALEQSDRGAGLGGLTVLSCDNLADNGRQLARLMGEYLDHRDPGLRAWFEAECVCPSTMVDRIVPATTEADRAKLAGRFGLIDEAAVMTEPFSRWVIEDRFAGPRPRWEAAGAELVADVQPYETAKLRMLNGAHSALAYIGLARGHTYVHEAIADAAIRPLIERLMREEAAPTIAAAPGQDLAAYAGALLARFANPALQHKLIQIAMDSSQKIPQRWLETLAANRAMGGDCPAILAGLAAWIHHLRGANAAKWGPVDDPRATDLAAAAASPAPLDALCGPSGLLASAWTPGDADRIAVIAQLARSGRSPGYPS